MIIDGDEVAWIRTGGQAQQSTPGSIGAGAVSFPVSWTATTFWYSPATDPRSSPRGWLATLRGRRYHHRVQATRSADDQTLHANVSRLAGTNPVAQRNHGRSEIKSRYG